MNRIAVFFFGVILSAPCFGTITLQISPSLPSPQLVGTPITWTATATDTEPGTLTYQFSISSNAGAYQVSNDYDIANSFTWVPSSKEGSYSMQVIARNKSAGDAATVQQAFTVNSRVTGNSPVITPTANPLVALYSAPGCPAGSSMFVHFGAGPALNQTSSQPCTPGQSMNFYVAGIPASTQIKMQHVIQTGTSIQHGPTLPFTTGTIPTSLQFPPVSLPDPVEPQTDSTQPVLLVDHMGPQNANIAALGSFMPTAYNLKGNVIWYYAPLGAVDQNGAFYLRPINGGTIMLHAYDPNSALVVNQFWREIDLAGNTIRQTNAARVNEMINAAGYVGCTSFSHDAIRLPNGHTLIICTQEKIYPPGTQGATGFVDIAGSGIVDLDTNLQLAWYWCAYDQLDVNRPAVLGETITASSGFVPLVLAPIANDWLHSNSLVYIPSSGDLLISLRHQDWVAKINYANGTGDGSVIWYLGPDGSWTINSTDDYPWFTHQHDIEYANSSDTLLTLYDNGNTRVKLNLSPDHNSRGYALSMDEASLTCTPVLLQDLNGYSNGGGSAQLLANGDYHFDSAVYIGINGFYAQHQELQPESGIAGGTTDFLFQSQTTDYRSYRMASLYELN